MVVSVYLTSGLSLSGLFFVLTLLTAAPSMHLELTTGITADTKDTQSLEPQSHLEKRWSFEDERQYFQIIRLPFCENLTAADLLAIFADNPNIRLRCEQEQTVLASADLNSFGREFSYELDTDLPEKDGMVRLIESEAIAEVEQVLVRFPISPCVRPSGGGTGLVEVFVTLATLAKQMKEVTGTVPIIEAEAGRRQTWAKGNEFTYSTLCQYIDVAVRPAVEILTHITKFRTREWIIDPLKTSSVVKSAWQISTVAELAESTIVLACLSERYVPDVCSWTDKDAMAQLTKYAQPDNEH